MKMSSKARYGLYAAVVLAKNYVKDEYLNVITLSQATGVSEKYLEQIIALMKKANIVSAIRGATGGYKLADNRGLLTFRMLPKGRMRDAQSVGKTVRQYQFLP